jgi:hypothetical protein
MTPNVRVEAARELESAARIEHAASQLNNLRNRWLYPQDLITIEPEIVAGFPDRFVPISEAAQVQLAQRTLTALYNDRPDWVIEAHRELDEAVSVAYGWPSDISDEEALEQLLKMNLKQLA